MRGFGNVFSRLYRPSQIAVCTLEYAGVVITLGAGLAPEAIPLSIAYSIDQ